MTLRCHDATTRQRMYKCHAFRTFSGCTKETGSFSPDVAGITASQFSVGRERPSTDPGREAVQGWRGGPPPGPGAPPKVGQLPARGVDLGVVVVLFLRRHHGRPAPESWEEQSFQRGQCHDFRTLVTQLRELVRVTSQIKTENRFCLAQATFEFKKLNKPKI